MTTADGKGAAGETDARAEWRWLVRHKRRSVLETVGPDLPAPDEGKRLTLDAPAPVALGALDGSVELAATSGSRDLPQAGGFGPPAGMGALQLQGSLADSVKWKLGGLMSENEERAWRLAAEFVLEPGGAHELEVGAGYGASEGPNALLGGLPEPDRALGAAFVRDRWRLGDRVTATTGVRYTYLGFLQDAHHADAVVQVEIQSDADSVVRGIDLDAYARARGRPADAVDGGGLARDHLGAARGRPAPRAGTPLRGRRRAHARARRLTWARTSSPSRRATPC